MCDEIFKLLAQKESKLFQLGDIGDPEGGTITPVGIDIGVDGPSAPWNYDFIVISVPTEDKSIAQGVAGILINRLNNCGIDMSSAINSVIEERHRQITDKNYNKNHDRQHTDFSLTKAAICYAEIVHHNKDNYMTGDFSLPELDWPWAAEHLKPKSPRRDLVRAAALLIAEIERLDSL